MKTRLFHPDESLDRNPTDDGAKFHLAVGVVNEAGYTHAIDIDMCCRPQYTRLLYVTWDMGIASSLPLYTLLGGAHGGARCSLHKSPHLGCDGTAGARII